MPLFDPCPLHSFYTLIKKKEQRQVASRLEKKCFVCILKKGDHNHISQSDFIGFF